ncbi:MAG: hypothetical protein H8E10_18540 [Desulfobacterales bacterium]|nr:hypothetical protein [Desulfobacterales bacterium]MBL7205130.1 hypothetical protein [Desulfobacteraceae bacterium]
MGTKLDYSVKHSLSGRLRVASPTIVSNKELAHCIKMHLANGRGVARVVTNHYSGSVTIYYDPGTTGEEDLFDMLDNVTWEKLVQSNGQISKSNDERLAKNQPPKGGRESGVWKLAGKVLGAVGLVAVFIPLLPGVPLILLAALCQEKADDSTN